MRSRGAMRAVSCVCFTLVLGALLTVCAISGCKNTPENHKILSFFFDGVPDPNEAKKTKAGEENAEPGDATDSGPSIHEPTRKEQDRCGECHGTKRSAFHERGFSGIDIGSISMAWETCTTCHSDPEKVDETSVIVRSDRWMHGPVAANRCQDCHYGHRSKHPHLLRSDDLEAICRSCHEQLPAREGAMAKLLCTECHEPHSAAKASDLFLRGGLAGSCLRCHPIETTSRPWMHGPVAKGVCQACHSGHGGTGYENHIQVPVRDTCFHCHNPIDICGPGKAAGEGADCISCHDPHSATRASDQFLRDRIEANGGAKSAFVVTEPEDAGTPEAGTEPQSGSGS